MVNELKEIIETCTNNEPKSRPQFSEILEIDLIGKASLSALGNPTSPGRVFWEEKIV